MKLSNLMNLYLEQNKFFYKKRTYLYYSQIAEIYIADKIGSIEIADLSDKLLNEYLGEMYLEEGIAYSTVNIIKSLINRALDYGYNQGLLSQKIKSNVRFKQKEVKNVNALTIHEQEKIENYILNNQKFYSYGVLISIYTGVRIGELLSLKWDKVDFGKKVFFITSTTCKICENHKLISLDDTPKTKSSLREVPINRTVERLLRELKSYQKGKSEFVISRESGKKIDIRSYQDSFSRLLKKLAIRHYGFHSLRHTFATRCLENGVDIKTISEILGHANPTITLNRYVHTNLQNKINAINLITKKVSTKIG